MRAGLRYRGEERLQEHTVNVRVQHRAVVGQEVRNVRSTPPHYCLELTGAVAMQPPVAQPRVIAPEYLDVRRREVPLQPRLRLGVLSNHDHLVPASVQPGPDVAEPVGEEDVQGPVGGRQD
eukprot:CAMPEP_0179317836 /NCGR_PEP_ID=MMETSP0797-20121207/56516_1 /TAXON_ID=47934 /ORGANISM="Dinophysis acuminata, Strain DAEP01" /LENGTH=120 /DNA_ID=CAMNT_0021028871 /DNA_START=388 /DNA_END=747 /DNA_ORIENTATION=+